MKLSLISNPIISTFGFLVVYLICGFFHTFKINFPIVTCRMSSLSIHLNTMLINVIIHPHKNCSKHVVFHKTTFSFPLNFYVSSSSPNSLHSNNFSESRNPNTGWSWVFDDVPPFFLWTTNISPILLFMVALEKRFTQGVPLDICAFPFASILALANGSDIAIFEGDLPLDDSSLYLLPLLVYLTNRPLLINPSIESFSWM